MADPRPVIYCTQGWGVHDDRWVAGLETLGFPVTPFSLGNELSTPAALREAVVAKQRADPNAAVLAGPLDSVTTALKGLPHLVGLSWGFDFTTNEPHIRDLLQSLAGIVVDSEVNVKQLLSAGIEPARITFLPWGIDPDVFTPDGPRFDPASLDLSSSARIILSLRAHEPMYRLDDIITAFVVLAQQQPDTALIIGHSGTLTPPLRESVESMGIADRVRFIGTVNEVRLPELLRSADLYVSAASVDGTSVTMLQAMACAIPCVVSDIPQNTYWIRNDATGFTFRTANPEDLARVMCHALEHADAAIRMAARHRVLTEANWPANLTRLAQAMQNA